MNTDGSGAATAPTFTANGTVGTYNVTATLVGTTLTAVYSLKNIANTATTVTSSLNPSLFGQSVTFAGVRAGLRTVIVVPHGNAREQNAAMRGLGAELIEFGKDFQDALEHARLLAAESRLHFIDSFSLMLVQGVASYALELFRSVPDLDYVYVPIGMGSGICGTVATRNAKDMIARPHRYSAWLAPALRALAGDGLIRLKPA